MRGGSFLPNRRDPDILCPPKSLSPDIKFGTISVRTFYWAVIDSYEKSKEASAESATVKVPFFIYPMRICMLDWVMSMTHFGQKCKSPPLKCLSRTGIESETSAAQATA